MKHTYSIFKWIGPFDQSEFVGTFITNLRYKEAYNIMCLVLDVEHTEHGIYMREEA